MRILLALLLGAMAVGSADAAPVPKQLKKNPEAKLLGTWRLTASDSLGNGNRAYEFYVVYKTEGELEFYYQYPNGRKIPYYGTYKLIDGDKVDYSITRNGNVKTEILTMTKFTRDEINWTDPDGLKESFEKAEEEKK